MPTKHRPKSPQFTVEITSDIIDASKSRDSSHCMIADAIRGAYPDAQRIAVDLQTIRFTNPKQRLRYTYLTPRIGQVSLIKFDQGVDVEPFSFRLRGGHVTLVAEPQKSTLLPKSKRHVAAGQKTQELRRQSLRAASNRVPERVGGKAPPVMKDSDSIPISRRREFGLRALTP